MASGGDWLLRQSGVRPQPRAVPRRGAAANPYRFNELIAEMENLSTQARDVLAPPQTTHQPRPAADTT
jgi:hypothetical protein